MIYTIVRKNSNEDIDAVISFDSIKSMDEAWSATVTTQTVEYGFDITDNINIESPTYTISAMLSSYSLFDLNRELVWNGEDFISNGIDIDKYSHVEARDEIIRVFKSRSVLSLIESNVNSVNEDYTQKVNELTSGYFREIPECVMTSLSITHPSDGTGCFYVNITLQAITRADVVLGELAEGEKRAALKPLMQVFEPRTASQKSETETTDPETGLADESSVIAKPNERIGNWEAKDAANRANRGLDSGYQKLEVIKDATFMTEMNGEIYGWEEKGGNTILVKGVGR